MNGKHPRREIREMDTSRTLSSRSRGTQEPQVLDIVRVRKGIHGKDLNHGDCGLVVMIYGDPPKDADVEFTTPQGQKNLMMLPLKWLEIVEDEENEN